MISELLLFFPFLSYIGTFPKMLRSILNIPEAYSFLMLVDHGEMINKLLLIGLLLTS